MLFLYNLAIKVYWLLIKIASWRNAKAKEWIAGRMDWQKRLIGSVDPQKETVWFHCASLGEFEQGRPVIEKYKTAHPGCQIVLTFFSPSGYSIRKDYEQADVVAYLPLDTPSNARKFIEIINPEKAVFVKYEYWYHFIKQLQCKSIPVYIISAIFRDDQVFFRRWGGWYRKLLAGLTHIFVQDENSRELLAGINITNVTVLGDTRFDRVAEIASKAEEIKLIKDFTNNNSITVIAGSTWPGDEQLLISFINNDQGATKYIIAPHEVDGQHISEIEKKLDKSSVRYTRFTSAAELNDEKVLIIDCIGILSSAYRYGDVAYIGGGFGVGIHNILEAATYGIPVIFGPNYSKFREARDLIALKGAFPVNDYDEFEKLLTGILRNPKKIKEAGSACFNYVNSNIGSSGKIVENI